MGLCVVWLPQTASCWLVCAAHASLVKACQGWIAGLDAVPRISGPPCFSSKLTASYSWSAMPSNNHVIYWPPPPRPSSGGVVRANPGPWTCYLVLSHHFLSSTFFLLFEILPDSLPRLDLTSVCISGRLWTCVLPAPASWVSGIAGLSHQHLA